MSIFGGIIAANRTVDKETAILLNEIFLEIVLAPDFTEEAKEILTRKKNIRLLKVAVSGGAKTAQPVLTTVEGGALVQESDVYSLTEADLKVVSERRPTEEELKQLLFCVEGR